VTLYQGSGGGSIRIGHRSAIHRDSVFETGDGGSIEIGDDSHMQARCQLSAYKGSVRIGNGVQVAPGCAFYPYDHGTAAELPMRQQPIRSTGDIVVGDDAWLGFGVVLLDGARVGPGAVVGAGSVVTGEIPGMAIAVGAPARVVGRREKAGAPAVLGQTPASF
jgi:acetyltransferase-like isoleucine patch superfamily enzyme